MKILAFNGSPRKKNSNTDKILQPFLEGAREAGAETETVYLQGKKIAPCLGCFKCWFDTPGECCQKDDHPELLKKFVDCDTVVYATPLYIFGMTAQMKLFLDRIVPMAMPFIEIVDGHCTHPARAEHRVKSMVVMSNCGFHELDNFDELMAHFRAISKHSRVKIAGALLRPHGEFLQFADQFLPDLVKPVYEAAREAGRQLVKNGVISDEVQAEVAKELMPLEGFLMGANETFKKMIEEGKGLEEMAKEARPIE